MKNTPSLQQRQCSYHDIDHSTRELSWDWGTCFVETLNLVLDPLMVNAQTNPAAFPARSPFVNLPGHFGH